MESMCAYDIDLFHPETNVSLKDCRDQFNRNMARHLLVDFALMFEKNGPVNLGCLYEISRMSVQDAKEFLGNLSALTLSDHPVAQCFLECDNADMIEGILNHVRRVARQYIQDCTLRRTTGMDTGERLVAPANC